MSKHRLEHTQKTTRPWQECWLAGWEEIKINHLSLAASWQKVVRTVQYQRSSEVWLWCIDAHIHLNYTTVCIDMPQTSTLEHYCDMATGAKLKWLSDYRITIQRRSMSEESGIIAQKQTKGTFLSLADISVLPTWLKVVNILFFQNFEVVIFDCNKLDRRPDCNAKLQCYLFVVVLCFC